MDTVFDLAQTCACMRAARTYEHVRVCMGVRMHACCARATTAAHSCCIPVASRTNRESGNGPGQRGDFETHSF